MQKSILTIICLIGLSFCQVQYGGTPKFFNERSSLDINTIEINQLNIVDRNFNPMVFVYGNEYDVNIDVLNSSTVIEESGLKTYLLEISSDGAYGIGLNFDQFSLSENSSLFIYDADRTFYLGALTNKNNKLDNILSTSIVKGDKIIIELTVPSIESNRILLHLT